MESSELNHEIWLNPKKVEKRPFYFFFKRTFDIVLSFLAIVVLSPLFLILALLIKFDGSHGKILYSQVRVGIGEKPFKMYKFRSMIPNADKELNKLKKYNEIDGAMFKMKDDPRVTKIGRFIRKYSLDELPQLFNVFVGSMSIVGPRPPLPAEVQEYNDYDKQIFMVKPGCTGLWQVTARNDADFDERVNLDLTYIKESSFSFDLKIILKTFKIMVKPNTAY